MGQSYRNELVVAMRTLLPGQFFRGWPFAEMWVGRRSGWLGRGC
jgi:hypothetical protein